ncbi:lipid IV(A) 3-deoxy-D-manno-octulosonic acid transferase [Leeia sp. TBRC 13508]|uniref:3-deoxy-D-manno-octulosonic acid transferase n=1 Tax=Leeia speluncae TaxID=2884804 RepID=A0ABS8D3I9_9NEIS|nr:lipid IV(A) 3-deoxy-D-manno-octulosonic acid transferase [Leeia speluncae]MCB6182593.1 lipid IV(A) 3-deoxy-D-manno-octulosonic acid transferase [Leeia speluncae]
MALFLYRIVWIILLPFALLRVWLRGKKEPAYRLHWQQRLGIYPKFPQKKPIIWIHAVSLGETRAAQPLVISLKNKYPNHHLLITHMTATGRTAAESLYGEFATIATLPYDLSWLMSRFFQHFKPAIGIIMETEVWPALCQTAAKNGIPLALVNARLSAKSARGYQRFSALLSPALKQFSLICAQSSDDQERLSNLGANHIHVCGNLKFDVQPSDAQIELGLTFKTKLNRRPAFLFASSREGEEALILSEWKQSNLRHKAILIIVPRHPQRFDEVADCITAHELSFIKRSSIVSSEEIQDTVEVLLGDSMGEMGAYYTASDLCLIGGSLAPLGGQNLIEAAAYGCPSLFGPHMFNFAEASKAALTAGASKEVADVKNALLTAEQLLSDNAAILSMRNNAHQFAKAHQGATQKIVGQLAKLINQ